MKCPKCGYVSFDHNTTCPKCSKDISEERNRLNLPDFEPAVPFLLGALTGEIDEAGMDIDIAAPEEAPPIEDEEIPLLEEEEEVASLDEDLEISLDDDWSPEAIEEESVVADELSDFESPGEEVSLGPEEEEDLGLDLEEDEDLGLDLEGAEEPVVEEQEELDLSAMEEGGGVDEEISLDLEDLSPDVATPEVPDDVEDESALGTEEDLELDLEDLSPEGATPREPAAEASPAAEADDDLGLDLEELSLDDDELTEDITFEDTSPTEEEAEPEFDLDSIALDEEEGLTEPPESGEQDEEVVLNLDDLKVNETGELEIGSDVMEAVQQEAESVEEDDETTIDLDEIALDEPTGEEEPAEPAGAALASDDFTMNLDDLSLEDEATPGGGEDEEEELSLDLDDLELDLDLEEEGPKESS